MAVADGDWPNFCICINRCLQHTTLERQCWLALQTMAVHSCAVCGGGQRHPSTAIVKRIIENNTVTQAELTECLRFACGSGNLDVVKMLLERGADANGQDEKYKFFPLHNAILKGHIEIIRELLSHGANPKSLAWGWEDNSLSGSTSTLVELALELGYCEIAKILESSHTNA